MEAALLNGERSFRHCREIDIAISKSVRKQRSRRLPPDGHDFAEKWTSADPYRHEARKSFKHIYRQWVERVVSKFRASPLRHFAPPRRLDSRLEPARHCWSPDGSPFPTPEPAECSSTPADQSGWFHNHQSAAPVEQAS